MQFEIDDQTDDASESTKPVAPGTSCYECVKDGNSSLANVFGFFL
jgi:hypothetical protein